jgi:hypothetical protein
LKRLGTGGKKTLDDKKDSKSTLTNDENVMLLSDEDEELREKLMKR